MKNFFCTLGLMAGTLMLLLGSCSEDATQGDNPDVVGGEKVEVVRLRSLADKNETEKYLVQFAKVLSKATYDRRDVRAFLKKEAVKQFDKNYDVLYELAKDEMINGETFREILVSYSSEEEMQEIEANVPLLNILVAKVAMFNVKPEELNLEDKEIPVAVSRKSVTSLFLNGKDELDVPKGEVPDFHVFVVNENSRVEAVNRTIPAKVMGSSGRRVKDFHGASNGIRKSVTFKSPNYDGSRSETRSVPIGGYAIGTRVADAFSHFNENSGGAKQIALQRDYIYYGLLPSDLTNGKSINHYVREYINYIEVNPRAYFQITSEGLDGTPNVDPYIKRRSYTQDRHTLTEQEIIECLWARGAYNFRFEIETSNSKQPIIVYVPLRPEEIWDFHVAYEYKHHTTFRHSKHTYKIDPNKFTAKKVYLNENQVSLGTWDLGHESMTRFVTVVEEDERRNITYTHESEYTYMQSGKVSADIKFGIGIFKIGIGADIASTKNRREKKVTTVQRTEGSDMLGRVLIYFYDPIIESATPLPVPPFVAYNLHTYNTGFVTFSISAK